MSNLTPQMEIEAVYTADYLHLVNHVMIKLNIAQLIDEHIPHDAQCKVSPGQMVQAIVLDILTGRRALVHLEEWAGRVDIKKLISPDVEASHFNDDAIGRVLDRIHESNPHQLFSDITLQTWKEKGDPSLFFHSDTTSQSVYGAYRIPEDSSSPRTENTCEEPEPFENIPLRITKGYSRDRPGANQFQYGVIVDKNGIAIHTDVHNGNTSDKTWNADVIGKLDKQLKKMNLSEFVYVADAAAMTQETLNQVNEAGGYLITRGPRNLKMVKEALDQVDRQDDQWSEPLTVQKKKQATVYRVQEIASDYYGQPVRLIVVESSSLAKTKENALKKQREEEHQSLQKVQKGWTQQTFHCPEDAEKEITRWLKKNHIRFHQVESEIIPVLPKKKKRSSGSEDVPSAEEYRIEIRSMERDEEYFEQLVRQGSRFVLVATVPPVYKDMEMDATQILRAYKGQINVEMTFSYLKDPFFVDAVYLKKPHRIQVLGYILLISLLVYKVFQQLIREHMEGEEEPLRGVGKRKLYKPTAQAVFHIFEGIQVIVFRLPTGERIRKLVSPLTVDQRRVLHFLGLDDTVYT
jgi:transposase